MSAASLSRDCPVCGRDEAGPCLEKSGLKLERCRSCGMTYVNPVSAEFTSGQYYDQVGAEYYVSPDKLAGDYADVRFERELRLFRRHCRGGAVLDVGCSSGAFLFQLNQRFPGVYQVLGMDVSGPALDYAASRGVAVLRGDFPVETVGDKKFDAVTIWAVLEHLTAPKQFLERAWSVLKPGGLCFALVPNLKSLAARLLGRRYRYIYPQHLNYFTRATFARLLESRFEIVELRTTHFNPILVWQDWRGGGKEVSNQERAELLRRTTFYKQNPVLTPVKFGYRLVEKGLSVLGLADNLTAVLRRK